jgi:hypothetical protein
MTDTPVRVPPNMPGRMRQLPRDTVGRPIPFFAAEVEGKHDFRVMDPLRLAEAITQRRCFVCGQRLNVASATFVVGPMCVVNRVSGEPPNHRDCAEWSVRACPFLSKPAKERRETNLPEGATEGAGGIMIHRNPGVSALVTARSWYVEHVPNGIVLRIREIKNVTWWAEGRLATRSEVQESIDTGLPLLRSVAEQEGPAAERDLERMVGNAQKWLP